MIKYFTLAIFALTLLACGGSKNAKKPDDGAITSTFDWVNSDGLMPLLEEAKRKNKPIFLDFYTDWCIPCKMMDETVYMDKKLGDYMNKNFINYKVDAESESGARLATIFTVEVYPTLIFVDTDGKVVERKNSGASQTELKNMGERALDAFGR